MISLLIGGIIFSSGSVLCCAVSKHKYEDVLPISVTAVMLILFLFGLAGNLPMGVAVTVGIAILIYLFTIFYLVKHKAWKSFTDNLFTPGFLLFVAFYVINLFLQYGRQPYHWDEFSHWALVVKVMSVVDDFGTSPLYTVPYHAYPPGMALLQYFFNKLGGWIEGATFVEWKLSFVWCIYLISFVVPFVSWFHKEQWKKILFCATIIIITPLFFYSTLYYELYVDPFLGVVAGCGLATLWFTEEKDAFYYGRLAAICATLTLAKDAGFGLALFLCLFCVVDIVFASKKAKEFKHWIGAISVFISAVIPKLLWHTHIKNNGGVLGKDTIPFSREFLSYFCKTLYQNGVELSNTGMTINYVALSVILFFVIVSLCFIGGAVTRKDKIMLLTLCIQHIGYIVGLAVTYLVSFGGGITSFSRYINIEFLAIWMFLILMVVNKVRKLEERKGYLLCIGCLCVIMFVSPLDGFMNFVTRKAVSDSTSTRAFYTDIGTLIQEYTPEDAWIHVIAQGTNGFDYLIVNYDAVPRATCGFWSVSASETDDFYTRSLTPDEWMDYLVENEYGYVALYKVDEAFQKEYASLFGEGSVIEDNSLYKVDAENRILILIASSERAD